jgi:hypothetical protein
LQKDTAFTDAVKKNRQGKKTSTRQKSRIQEGRCKESRN